ncbi:MAG TPA: MBL fold metallo-hydrolase [Vicinamibacterales bacterium]|nr:MBL fold metallo-hydrolase [Vicinamibacterales bacterium]
MTSSLTFLGAAGTVTGSKHLLTIGDRRVLVDCGLFQGLKELRLRNWAAFPIDPAQIDAVILTHAHLDHCGYLPRFVAQGFRGRVFCTAGTRDLCTLILPDSARIQEEDARQANRHRYSKHSPAQPLYTETDAVRALDRLQPVGYDRPIEVVPGVEVDFINAGHLLGSAYALVSIDGHTILFGGDLGRYGRPILPDPTPVHEADILLLESTYGDRLHEPDDDGERLAKIVQRVVGQGGRLIVPAFAVGRVVEVLYWLKRLEDARRIPMLPVYVDSPMASAALTFYRNRLSELDQETRPATRDVTAFSTRRMTVVESVAESKSLVSSSTPAIVIASSGMATGGRVLHHLEAALPDSRNTVLFVGYQAAGTRGRLLCDGAKQVKLHGHAVPVGARVERIDSMSAHADAGEIMRWLSAFVRPPTMTYLVHGEPGPLEALAARIVAERQWAVHIARHLERVELNLG